MKILCWLWRQPKSRVDYTAEHVNVWARMMERHLTIPHTIACVTDIPRGIDDHIEIIPLPEDFAEIDNDRWSVKRGYPQCYRRLSLFAPDAAERFGHDRLVSMDLDCVVTQNIDSLFDRDDDFVMFKGTALNRPYNGSLIMLTAGARTQVYEQFSQQGAKAASQVYMGSDQAWIAYCLGWLESTWSEEDGVYFMAGPLAKRLVHRQNVMPESLRLLFFPGTKTKPWESQIDWVREAYR